MWGGWDQESGVWIEGCGVGEARGPEERSRVKVDGGGSPGVLLVEKADIFDAMKG